MIDVVRRKISQFAESTKRRLMYHRLTTPRAVAAVNRKYNRLSPEQKIDFYRLYGKIFREDARDRPFEEIWSIKLHQGVLKLPLSGSQLWLHWDSGLSTLGHDSEVKTTYFNLIRSANPPDLFIDIGANYGTHSLMFLKAGIRTITFEPNPTCADYFLKGCALNGLTPQLEAVALSNERGTLDMAFVERETWNGSADPEVVKSLEARGQSIRITVRSAVLDDYIPQMRDHRHVVVKIDVEGLEDQVLKGAGQTLATVRPLIIFECNDRARLEKVQAILADAGYRIGRLPWTEQGVNLLGDGDLATTNDTNFIAYAGR